MDDRVKFQRKLGDKGGSIAVTLPIELANYLEIQVGDDVQMFSERGKHGKFIALWKKKEE